MSTEDTPNGAMPEPAASPESTTASPRRPSWNRRTFLKAAALGTAAAALLHKSDDGGGLGGLSFGPLTALADDLSSLNCTANDVRIVGPGIILNEPCDCPGTFTAQVQFHIINNTGTDRYCVTAHLCPGVDANGNVIVPAPANIIFGDIPANFDGIKTITIPNYPCGSGKVCFGAAGSQADGGFAKGEACPTGKCCTTITWNVKASDPCPDTTRQISSKCRHQQICIVGRGTTTLDCDTSLAGVQTNCQVPCNGVATVRLCTTSPANFAPFTFALSDGQTFGPTTDTCHDFTIGPLTQDTVVTGTVTDKDNCAKSATVTLRFTPLAAPVLSRVTGPDCDGNVVVSVTNCDPTLTYVFKDNGSIVTDDPPGDGDKCKLTKKFAPGDHTITVEASNAASCKAGGSLAPFTVNPPVTVTLSAPSAGCDGKVTLTATGGGGDGTNYTFAFSGASGTVSGNTITLNPQLDGNCRTVTCIATSAGCSSPPASRSFSQCVTTTAC